MNSLSKTDRTISAASPDGQPQSLNQIWERLGRAPAALVLVFTLACAFLLRMILNPLIGSQFPYATFYIAVVICAMQGGVANGLIAAVLGYFLGALFFGPDHGFLPGTLPAFVGSVIYLINCVVVNVLVAAQRVAYFAMKTHAQALEIETIERKQAETARREMESRYRTLYELTSDFAFGARLETDGNLRPEWITEAFTRVTGWDSNHPGGIAFLELVPDEERDAFQKHIANVKAGNESILEHRLRTQDGKLLWFRNYIRPREWDETGQVVRVIGAAQDITTRKQEQEQTSEALRRLELVLEGAGLGTWQFDIANQRYIADPRARRIHGHPPDDLETLKEAEESILPDDLPIFRESVQKAMEEEGGHRSEYRVRLPDGSIHWVMSYGKVIPLLEGPCVFGIVQDITERKQIEEAVRVSERRYRSISEGLPQFVWIADRDGNLEYINSYILDYTGLPAEAYATQEWFFRVIHPEDVQFALERFAQAKETPSPYTVDYRIRRYDGSFRWQSSHIVPLCDAGGQVIQWLGTGIDVHDRVTAEEERETYLQEIEALNIRLRRAVQETHHRVKNNLQVIAALAEMEVFRADMVPVAVLHRISQHARSLALIHDILTQQSRELGSTSESVPVRRIMERLIPLVEATIGEHEVTYTLADFPVTAREGAAMALLVNELVSNAVKHSGGKIEVVLSTDNGNARLEVLDNGPGFPTTFDVKNAANTGLELVQSVSEWDLRGGVTFTNRPEGGALVTVTFPIPQETSGF